jgi:dephospho-CoA kinase
LKTFGLTGGIGMGKSAASDLLRQRKVPTVDTDDLARQVVQPGQPALQQIRNAFGDEVLSQTGELRRDVLAAKVFSDPGSRLILEGILHPPIRFLWREQLSEWEKQGHPVVIVVIPLLFETGAEKELDATICVACSPATQVRRLAPRRWSGEQTRQRMDAQFSIDQKIAKADFVVWNEAGLDVLWAQIARIVEIR